MRSIFLAQALGCLLLSQTLAGQVTDRWNVESVLTIAWDDSTGIPYTKVPGANLGVVAFAMVHEDQVAMLCNGIGEIRVFSTIDNSLMYKFPVEPAPRDLAFNGTKYFILFDRHVAIHSEDGQYESSFSIPHDALGVTRLAVLHDAVYLWLPAGNSMMVFKGDNVIREEYGGWACPNGDFIYTAIVDGKAEATWYSGGVRSVRSFAMDRKVAGVSPVGVMGSKVILDVQTFISENPVAVQRHFVAIDIEPGVDDSSLSMLKAPDTYFVYADRDIYQQSDGNIYNMVTSPNGVHLFRIAECNEGPCMNYPAELRSLNYHFNYHLIKID